MRICKQFTHGEIVARQARPLAPDDPYLADGIETWLPTPTRASRNGNHDPATRSLIRQYAELERLPNGFEVVELLERWRWLDAMSGPEAKQEFVERLILKIQRNKAGQRPELLALLVICEPIRRSVTKELMDVRRGLVPNRGPRPDWHRREEARRLHEIEVQTVFDVTRAAVLESIARYPGSGVVERFFPWLRATVSHRSLSFIGTELSELGDRVGSLTEASAVQRAIEELQELEPPALADASRQRSWHSSVELRPLFADVERFYEHGAVRRLCRAAVGRLAPRQQQVIEGLFYEDTTPQQLADRRGVSRSTIDNTRHQALARLRTDDVFYVGLRRLGVLRRKARQAVDATPSRPEMLPDGRRRVVIDRAA